MSLLDKFKEQFTDRDDEYEDEEYEEEGTSIDTAQPIPPPSGSRPCGSSDPPGETVYHGGRESERLSGCRKIGNHLKAARPVVMNMEKTDADEAQRIVDFIQGVMYALDGRIDQVSENIYLCAPNNMSVSRENFAAFPEAEAPAWDSQA